MRKFLKVNPEAEAVQYNGENINKVFEFVGGKANEENKAHIPNVIAALPSIEKGTWILFKSNTFGFLKDEDFKKQYTPIKEVVRKIETAHKLGSK